MTDREQTRRDAEWLSERQTVVSAETARRIGAVIDALLAELEQKDETIAKLNSLVAQAMDPRQPTANP